MPPDSARSPAAPRAKRKLSHTIPNAASADCSSTLGRPTRLGRLRMVEAEVRALAEAGDLEAETARAVNARLERRARVLQGLPADGQRASRRTLDQPAIVSMTAAVPVPEVARPLAPEPIETTAAPEPAEGPVPPPSPDRTGPLPPPARRGSVLAGFMEERNILWGEVVGGLLIVGCSIALIVTLWHRLESIPYFPFLLSAAVTLALYGAGHYTLHHWKLESTSRGLLVIALLLAPLNLLLLSDPITRTDVAFPLDLGVKLGAIALLTWIVRGGGRDVLTPRPEWRWLVALAVVGAPATQLLPVGVVSRLECDSSTVARTGVLHQRRSLGAAEFECGRARTAFPRRGAALLQFVGLAAFGLAAAWGLHAARSSDAADRVRGSRVAARAGRHAGGTGRFTCPAAGTRRRTAGGRHSRRAGRARGDDRRPGRGVAGAAVRDACSDRDRSIPRNDGVP